MNRTRYRNLHRQARLGALGSLCFTAGASYPWFLREVFDLRHPRIGDDRHLRVRTFDSLRGRIKRVGHSLVRIRFA